jgi:rhodanese-related sulfurtransferase
MVNEFELVPIDVTESDDLAAIGDVVLQRTARFTVHDMLFEARRMIERIDPSELARRCDEPNPPTVVDTRTHVDRRRHGVIPGAIHVPRTVLEWHLDPANGYQHPSVTSFAQPLVVVCNGGYSSSLAAASLMRIGYGAVADLIGGHHAWCSAGFGVDPPDHSHLDL